MNVLFDIHIECVCKYSEFQTGARYIQPLLPRNHQVPLQKDFSLLA